MALKSHYDLFVPQLNRCDTLPVISLSLRIYFIVLSTISVCKYYHEFIDQSHDQPSSKYWLIYKCANRNFWGVFFLAILGAKNENSSRSPQYPEMLHLRIMRIIHASLGNATKVK